MGIVDSALSYNRPRFFNVKIGEIVVAEAPAILKTTLGSCVAVILYDHIRKIGSMIHIMFPDSKGEPTESPGKFADLGIPLLLKKTLDYGAERRNLEVSIVGGNYLTQNIKEGKVIFDVGKSNLNAVRKALMKENMSFKEYDIQQNTGTIAIFDVSTGKLQVKFLEKFKKSKISYQKSELIDYDDFLNIVKFSIKKILSSMNKTFNATVTNDESTYDSALSVNIFGNLKGKLLIFVDKKVIYELFSQRKSISSIIGTNEMAELLKQSGSKLIKEISSELNKFFEKKNIKLKYTDPTVFTLNQYMNLSFNYPEKLTVILKFDDNKELKVSLLLGKIRSDL